MTVPRSQIVDPEVTPWYHCISNCARGASLLEPQKWGNPKKWLKRRLQELVDVFAVDVAGYAIMDTHFHVLVHLDVEAAQGWSKREVIERWARLYPPPKAIRGKKSSFDRWIEEKARDHKFVNTSRKRLANLGWFMKSLKEPLSRWINRSGGGKGTLWAARYKSIAVLDETALLMTCMYIDLNPFAAGLFRFPEKAEFTSLHERIQNCRRRMRISDLRIAMNRSIAGSRCLHRVEDTIWLLPVEDRRATQKDSRVGLVEGFTIGNYFLLLDQTSRLFRKGKKRLAPDAVKLLERLDTDEVTWMTTMDRLFSKRLKGVAFSTKRERLREAARARGVRHLANLNGCAAKQQRE